MIIEMLIASIVTVQTVQDKYREINHLDTYDDLMSYFLLDAYQPGIKTYVYRDWIIDSRYDAHLIDSANRSGWDLVIKRPKEGLSPSSETEFVFTIKEKTSAIPNTKI